MKVRQLAIFMENRAGRLAELTEVLAKGKIDIRGFSVADTAEYGIFRVLVDDPAKAKEMLKNEGFTVKETDVICVDVPDIPGGLHKTLKILADEGINVEYLYSGVGGFVVFDLSDTEKGIKVLQDNNIGILSHSDIVARKINN
ncbi:amino acid-binding ACT domain protein [Thermodesulfobium narugense DSM 14796]|uniref:Amino acid-binding ACT domain protein n=1 Tax=Thermodesulfobium narugense DSM 14796 TaxID=747365 RepID=M1E8N8_9BACT|nr:ACT domain-containing protein [Thermodesulfobium narugense]AEE15065.1 amino acid-binding ACT domain protein [Thermodesulfobium narugense DSM 14796]